MAVIHTAYTFNAEAFHQELEAKLVTNNQLRLDALHELAIEASNHPSESTKQALRSLGFDPEWLEPTDDDVHYTSGWYIIALAAQFALAPSLSNRTPASYSILERTLPLLGWAHDEAKALVTGEWLHTLVQASGNPLFIAEFHGVDHYGGWLSLDLISRLLSRLLLVEDFFTSPLSETLKAVEDYAEWWSQNPGEILHKAYDDAYDMLRTAVDRQQALFLLLN